MNATTHKHVYVGLAVETEDVRAMRDWVSCLDPTRYARLLDLLSNAVTNPIYYATLDELQAPNGEAREHLHAMELRGTAIHSHSCPRCAL